MPINSPNIPRTRHHCSPRHHQRNIPHSVRLTDCSINNNNINTFRRRSSSSKHSKIASESSDPGSLTPTSPLPAEVHPLNPARQTRITPSPDTRLTNRYLSLITGQDTSDQWLLTTPHILHGTVYEDPPLPHERYGGAAAPRAGGSQGSILRLPSFETAVRV